jgi:hypothetical protein
LLGETDLHESFGNLEVYGITDTQLDQLFGNLTVVSRTVGLYLTDRNFLEHPSPYNGVIIFLIII